MEPQPVILRALAILRRGGLIGLPTETVYGLAADAENELAVRSIFAAKGRPVDHPLIVHLTEAKQIEQWAIDIPDTARRLAAAFWPGPLTLILRRSDKAALAVTGGLDTIGLRVPSHPVAQQVLQAFRGGLAAPSANRFGRVSPTTAEHVREEFGDRVELVLEGGPSTVGIESTIVDLSSDKPALLRPGAITAQQIEQILKHPLGDPAQNTTRASGRLISHYAPRAAVEIVAPAELEARVSDWAMRGSRVVVLAAHLELDLPGIAHRRMPDSPEGFASELYAALREADASGAEIALVVPPPESGVGIAIADRLRKAAAPRDAM
jgi:L-threonylcarbamoyladenylate synthase